MKILRAHGMIDTVLQQVYRSVILSKLQYASCVRWAVCIGTRNVSLYRAPSEQSHQRQDNLMLSSIILTPASIQYSSISSSNSSRPGGRICLRPGTAKSTRSATSPANVQSTAVQQQNYRSTVISNEFNSPTNTTHRWSGSQTKTDNRFICTVKFPKDRVFYLCHFRLFIHLSIMLVLISNIGWKITFHAI